MAFEDDEDDAEREDLERQEYERNEREEHERQERERQEQELDITRPRVRTRAVDKEFGGGRRLRSRTRLSEDDTNLRLNDEDDTTRIYEDGDADGGDDATQRAGNRTPLPTSLPRIANPYGIAAALQRVFPHGFPPEIVAEDLKAQAEIRGDGARMAVFRVETLQQQHLTTFAFLQQKDIMIHLMHSPATYYARGASGPLKGKDIGFVGDRTEFSSPAPIVLQPEKPWKWITV